MKTEAFPHELQNRQVNFRTLIDYSKEQHQRIVNPWHALYAGVAPGLGYSYSGSKQTGIVAFVVVSVFSVLTYAAFRTDNESTGIFLGAAAAFFYSGSILGGYMNAARQNALVRDNLHEYLVDEMALRDDREMLFKNYGLKRR